MTVGMPTCAFGDCKKFIKGGRTREACYLCWLAHQPLGWHPLSEDNLQNRAAYQATHSRRGTRRKQQQRRMV